MQAGRAIREAVIRHLARQFLMTQPIVSRLPWIAVALFVAVPVVTLLLAMAMEPRNRC